MIRLLWALSVRARYYLRRCAPSNIALDWIRRRENLKWGVPAMLLAAPYLLIVSLCTTALAAGGPGVLNLIVLVAGYNAIKMTLMGPWSLVLLARARFTEAAQRRQARRQTATTSPEFDGVAVAR
jgi:hypothetical protein